MKRGLSAALIYLVIAAGVGAGNFANYPYKGNSIAVFGAAGAGLVWPVVVPPRREGRPGLRQSGRLDWRAAVSG